MNILVTGATGTLGTAIVRHFQDKPITVFSRDEYKQLCMKVEFPNATYVLGDIRDRWSLDRALHGIDVVIHCAALKQLPRGETDPLEFKKTNVDGAVNLIDGCISHNIQKCIVIDTDKAVEPISAYGCSKAMADHLFLDANKYDRTIFNICRFGNIMGSRGSVINKFADLVSKEQHLPVTDIYATRFWLDMDKAIWMIDKALNSNSGDIFVPKMPSFSMRDLIEAFHANFHLIGLQRGEKLHEVAITQYDKTMSYDDYFQITNNHKSEHGPSMRYDSFNNNWWLTVDEIREKIG